jgi:hypothetical protein
MKRLCTIFFLIISSSSFAQSSFFHKTDWTLAEIKQWAQDVRTSPPPYGLLLYQGSDSLKHHFTSRVMDEYVRLNVARSELKLPDERKYMDDPAASVGYYYVDGTNDFSVVTVFFRADTVVNKISLGSAASVIGKLKSDTSKIKTSFIDLKEAQGLPHLNLINKSGNQKLTLLFHPGNGKWAFSEFKVEYITGLQQDKSIRTEDREFVTGSGIKLGTKKGYLISVIGRPTNTRVENGYEIIEYRTTDRNSRILRRYNSPDYFAIYKLKDGRVAAFHFGFSNP